MKVEFCHFTIFYLNVSLRHGAFYNKGDVDVLSYGVTACNIEEAELKFMSFIRKKSAYNPIYILRIVPTEELWIDYRDTHFHKDLFKGVDIHELL